MSKYLRFLTVRNYSFYVYYCIRRITMGVIYALSIILPCVFFVLDSLWGFLMRLYGTILKGKKYTVVKVKDT